MKKLLIIVFILVAVKVFPAPSNTMSIVPIAVDSRTIKATDENARNNIVATIYNAHNHTSLVSDTITIGSGNAGDGIASDMVVIEVDIDGAITPAFRFSTVSNIWEISDDGSAFSTHSLVTGTVRILDTQTVTGTKTFSNLVATTADINGGTLDGVTIGATVAPTVTDLGSVATADINGGTVDGVTIGGATPAAGTFTNIVGTGTLTLNDLSNATLVLVDNDGTGYGLHITQDGVLTTGKQALSVISAADQNVEPLVFFNNTNGSTNKPTLQIGQSGSGVVIQGSGNENLSNAGVWTDRTSLFADKENLTPLDTAELVGLLKSMNLHRYQKKCEIYGNKKDKIKEGKKVKEYDIVKIRPNAKEYVGLILDDPTTPEELISRDLDGNINGKSGTQIAEFLLGVCQELIERIEDLETRVTVLESL